MIARIGMKKYDSPYEYDPNMPPDSDYIPGSLRLLVPGNRARLLDPRRTPVRIEKIEEASGLLFVRVERFEDKGSIREVPFEGIISYQFAKDSAIAATNDVARFEQRVLELGQKLKIHTPEMREATEKQIAEITAIVRAILETSPEAMNEIAALNLTQAAGSKTLAHCFRHFLNSQGLWDLEDTLAAQWVLNPGGELTKGHRIVLAELGLVDYDGKIPRSPDLFTGIWTKENRSRHIVHRLGFVRALFGLLGLNSLRLYRGLNFTDRLESPSNSTFLSATTRLEIAQGCFADHVSADKGALLRQQVSIDRVYMTYFETDHMNRQYKEAEIVLLFDPKNSLF